jgi:Zn-dependent membrane protease YugP
MEAETPMLLDSDYVLMGLPPFALAAWAQWRLVSVCRKAGRVLSASGLTGAEAARRVLRAGGMDSVEIETAAGQLADYYHAAGQVLRLSSGVASERSLAALGIAAHEAGHALQEGARFPGLWLRRAIVPLAHLCSTTFWMLVLAGLFLGVFRLIIASVFVLWFSVVFQLLNVPVELDASRRARSGLTAPRITSAEEDQVVHHVMSAVAWTHVAGVLTDIWPIRQVVASKAQVELSHADG